MRRTVLVAFSLANAVVLLGQVWPDGAPPFARAVNILFLVCSLIYFVSTLIRKR